MEVAANERHFARISAQFVGPKRRFDHPADFFTGGIDA
jgi:hypothetical protein